MSNRAAVAFVIGLSALAALPDAARGQARPPAFQDLPRFGRELRVVSVSPAPISVASPGTAITVLFDRPVILASIDASTFRVFGRFSGTATGSFAANPNGSAVTFTPSRAFSAGEVVTVTLSHDVTGRDRSALRSAGYAFQFTTATVASSATFDEIAVMSNNNGEQTRIYGASASDLDGDGFLDLTTVNEVSADLRVFMNLGDGTGAFSPFLPPTPIGVEASPNDPADFDNDGNADLCACATSSGSVWIALGSGDGSFGRVQEVGVGQEPHGVVALDVDGDGDTDIVNANRASGNLSLLLNDGTGTFGAPAYFDGGVSGEYGLATGDMNGDGILDLVVAGQDGAQIRTLLGNGNGTFAFAGPPRSSGGNTWVVVLGDVNGDRKLDATAANAGNGGGAVALGNGDGTFGVTRTIDLNAHTVSTDLGDLDGDGDLDWVLSSFGAQYWRLYRNDGAGNFTFWRQFDAPNNPSCAILFDCDNDGDLDMALTDEIADVVVLMENL